MTQEEMFVTVALKAWEQSTRRAGKLFHSLSDEGVLAEIAPGKNRAVYLFGHLLALSDQMLPQLRLGEAAHPELLEIFVRQPDGSVAEPPATTDLRRWWSEVHDGLDAAFQRLSPAEWLERHAMVSEEDFAKEPHRNRLALLHSRTSHVAYHMGQLVLLKK